MDWLVFSLGIALAGILGYFYYLWNIDRRRAWNFLASELVAMLFFTSLAYFVLNPSLLVGGSLEDFSIQLALNRTASLRDQFYQLHSQIVQTMEAAVVVDVIMGITAVVLTAGAAIPLLQAFNVGFQAVLGVMEGAATLAGTAYMLLNHLYWLLLVGQALAFLIPILGSLLVVPRARKVALSGLAVVFVLSVLLPYAVNTSYHSVAVPELKTSLPRNFGRVKFSVRDAGGIPVHIPVAVLLEDENHTLYTVRVVDGSVKYLPPDKYTIDRVTVYWTSLWVPPCCSGNGSGACLSCPAYPSHIYVENSTVSVRVTLPFYLIPRSGGAAGETIGYLNNLGPDAQRIEPGMGDGRAIYVLEPRLDKVYYIWFRAGGYSVVFPNQSVLAEKDPRTNRTLCWQLHYTLTSSDPWWLGQPADPGLLRRLYANYVEWYNRTRNAVPAYAYRLRPGELELHQPAGRMLKVWFTEGPCKCNETVAERNKGKNALIIINGTAYTWNDRNTRYLSYIGLWDNVIRAGEEVKGLIPVFQVSLAMLYNIYALVLIGGLAFGGLLGVAGYNLPGMVQGYFRQGLHRSFATLPGVYRKARFIRRRLDEKKAVKTPERRLGWELRSLEAYYGWTKWHKRREAAKRALRMALPVAVDIAGERALPGLVRTVLELHGWWLEYRTGWRREQTRGHYYLQRFYRAVRWTPLHLEEPIYRRLARLRLWRRPREIYNITLEDVAGRWPSYERDVAALYAHHARRALARVVSFVEKYGEKPYRENMEFAEAVEKGVRTVGDDEIKAMLKELNGVLERLDNASSVQDVERLVNQFYTHLHPHVNALLKIEGLPDHNKVLKTAMENALTDLAREDPRGFLALRALSGDYRALRYLSLADWIYTARPEEFSLNLDKEELGRLVQLAYTGNEEAFEALIGRLSEAELGLRNFFASRPLDELLELSYRYEMKVTGDLVAELVRQGLSSGFLSEAPLYRLVEAGVLPKEVLELDPVEVIQKINGEKIDKELVRELREEFLFLPEWLFKMDDVARVAVFEAAAKGLAPPLVETMLSLEAGESETAPFWRAYPREGVARLGREAEESLKGFIEYLEQHPRPDEMYPRLWDALKARLAALEVEAEKLKQDLETLTQYRLQLSTRLSDLYWIVREKLEEES